MSGGSFNRGGPGDYRSRTRANERIRVPQVRVIDAEGEQIGVMDTRDALAMARERGLDLVEVSPTARPPVCRIMDLGKFKYEESKKQRAAKKKQHAFAVKEVKLRPKIEDHDYRFKVANARKFLEQHHKVKVTIMFRGRELAHPEFGHRLLNRVIEELAEIASVEHVPKLEGRNLTTVLSPRTPRSSGGAKPRSRGSSATESGREPEPATPARTGEEDTSRR